MSKPSLDLLALKRAVSIETVLDRCGLLPSFQLKGPSLVGPCPLHRGDNKRAFVVHRAKNLWRCFTACNRGGDLIAFVSALLALDFPHSVRYLERLAAGPAPRAPTSPTHDRLGDNTPSAPFRPFRRALPLDPEAPFLQSKGILPSTAKAFDVGASHHPGWLEGCIAVRLFDPAGAPLGYAARTLDPHLARTLGKWKFPRALPAARLLYNFHRVAPAFGRACVLVECPWAVMRLAQLHIPALALLGIHLSDAQRCLLKPFPTLVLMFDADSPGRHATAQIRQRLEPHHLVRVVSLPDGADPDDLTDTQLLQFRSLLLP